MQESGAFSARRSPSMDAGTPRMSLHKLRKSQNPDSDIASVVEQTLSLVASNPAAPQIGKKQPL